MAAEESGAPEDYKQMVIESTVEDVLYTDSFGNEKERRLLQKAPLFLLSDWSRNVFTDAVEIRTDMDRMTDNIFIPVFQLAGFSNIEFLFF